MTRSPYDHPLARLANQLVAATDALAELEKQQTYVSTLNRNEENCHEFLNPDEDSTEIVNPAWVEASGTYPNVYSWEHPIVQEHTALWRMRRHARKRLGLAFLPKHCRGCKRSIYFPVDGLCEFCQRYGPPLPPDEHRAALRAELPMQSWGGVVVEYCENCSTGIVLHEEECPSCGTPAPPNEAILAKLPLMWLRSVSWAQRRRETWQSRRARRRAEAERQRTGWLRKLHSAKLYAGGSHA